jgi:hypothetical protein
MPQTLLTDAKITKETLMILHNNLKFTQCAYRGYDKNFAVAGAKIGSVINIRLPNQYYVSDGAALDVQEQNEQYTSLTLNHQWHTDMAFSTSELALSVDEFSDRYIKPATAKITSVIDYTGLGFIKKSFNQVGYPGATPGFDNTGTYTDLRTSKSPDVFLNAGAMLDYFGVPRDKDRYVVLDPIANAKSVAGLSGLFNPTNAISDQYHSGNMSDALGFMFYADQNVNKLTTGTHSITGAYALVSGAQTGNALLTTGWSLNQTVLKTGEIIQIAGVYSVNPENQQSTGQLANFTILADVLSDGSGNATISIYPSIVVAGSTVANGTTTIAAPDQGHITMFGSASTVYPMNVAFHRDAFVLGTADLEMPEGVHFKGREVHEGISLRIIRQYMINSDQIPCRIDVLGGWTCQRPELVTRIWG